MLQFIIYLVVAIATFRTGWYLFYDNKDSYTSDGEFQLFWLLCALLWPIAIPILLIWFLATIGRPKTPAVKRSEQEAAIAANKKELFRLQVHRADLEHENGYTPTDPPHGWVPKGDQRRYYNVDYKLQ